MDRRSFITGTLAGAAGAAGIWSGVALSSEQAARPSSASPAKPEGRQSYSQMGEDLVVYDLLHSWMKLDKPSYIDIGAADPVSGSNTYLLYKAGCHGVLVEPNPTFVEKLRLVRPRDVVVGVGVGVDDATEADYYVFRGRPMLNTFSPEEVAMRRQQSKDYVVEKVVKMPLVSVNHLIASHLGHAPDLLSIDVEGLDLAILRTLDFDKYRPAAIIAEAGHAGTANANPALTMFVESKGYVQCGGSLYNTVFGDPKRFA
jgi:FkbM family methyltransferase